MVTRLIPATTDQHDIQAHGDYCKKYNNGTHGKQLFQ